MNALLSHMCLPLLMLTTTGTLTYVSAQTQLTSQELFQDIQEGKFDVIVDVRRQDEWDDGHIPGATFVTNLASNGSPELLRGCQTCTIAVTCRTGGRAGEAITRLINEEGFDASKLYNGLGVDQWKAAGYATVNTDSVLPACSNTNPARVSDTAAADSASGSVCRASTMATDPPAPTATMVEDPTSAPVAAPDDDSAAHSWLIHTFGKSAVAIMALPMLVWNVFL